MEAAPRLELGIKDLQSSALPLGYAAVTKESITILDCGVKEGREISSHFLYELFLGAASRSASAGWFLCRYGRGRERLSGRFGGGVPAFTKSPHLVHKIFIAS